MSLCNRFPLLMKYLHETEFFCAAPFASVTTSVDGDYSLCCIATDFDFKVADKSFRDYFESDIVTGIQKEMLNGKPGSLCKHYCNKCLLHEAAGSRSRRTVMNNDLSALMRNRTLSRIAENVEFTLSQKLSGKVVPLESMGFDLIDFKIFGNLCNLKCLMCHPDSSSLIAKEQIELGIYSGPENYNPYEALSTDRKNEFYSELDLILPNTNTIRFTGGEPTINKSILEVVNWIVERGYNSHLEIHVTTNGMHISEELLQLILTFRAINISMSIDGYTEITEMQRRGSKFSVIDKNLSRYASHSKIDLYIVPTVTSFNCSRLDEIQSYSIYKLKKNVHLGFCLKPKTFSILYLPDEIRSLYLDKLLKSKYASVFESAIALLRAGEYDPIIFREYLNRVISIYGQDRILKYFPEYKPYVV